LLYSLNVLQNLKRNNADNNSHRDKDKVALSKTEKKNDCL